MSEKNKDLVRRWFHEVWNSGDEKAIDKMMHPESRSFGLGGQPLVGPPGFSPFYTAFKNNYSGIHVTIDKILADGDYVISLVTATATYKATNTPVKFTGTTITRVVNGQIKDAWNNYDFLSLHLQTGKIKPEQLA
jgi:predicted SnoaL-like aldol condensation-catalyzing enzyme